MKVVSERNSFPAANFFPSRAKCCSVFVFSLFFRSCCVQADYRNLSLFCSRGGVGDSIYKLEEIYVSPFRLEEKFKKNM